VYALVAKTWPHSNGATTDLILTFRLHVSVCQHVLQLGHAIIFVLVLCAMLLTHDDELPLLVDVVSIELGQSACHDFGKPAVACILH